LPFLGLPRPPRPPSPRTRPPPRSGSASTITSSWARAAGGYRSGRSRARGPGSE
jgi:hypothetical protein